MCDKNYIAQTPLCSKPPHEHLKILTLAETETGTKNIVSIRGPNIHVCMRSD